MKFVMHGGTKCAIKPGDVVELESVVNSLIIRKGNEKFFVESVHIEFNKSTVMVNGFLRDGEIEEKDEILYRSFFMIFTRFEDEE